MATDRLTLARAFQAAGMEQAKADDAATLAYRLMLFATTVAMSRLPRPMRNCDAPFRGVSSGSVRRRPRLRTRRAPNRTARASRTPNAATCAAARASGRRRNR